MAFSIGKLSQDLKNRLRYPRLHYCNIGEIMKSKILHAYAGEGSRLLKSECRLKESTGETFVLSGLVKTLSSRGSDTSS